MENYISALFWYLLQLFNSSIFSIFQLLLDVHCIRSSRMDGMTNSVEKPTSLSRVCSKVAVVGCQSSTWCPQQQENLSNLFLNSTSSFRRVSSALCTRACLHTLIFHSWAIAVFSILTYLLTSYDVFFSLFFSKEHDQAYKLLISHSGWTILIVNF